MLSTSRPTHRDHLVTRRSKRSRSASTSTLTVSRDQAQKVYVQDRIREQGTELWRWLQDGARLYICGDASHMAKDVDQALRQVAQTHGGLGVEGAVEYWRQLSEQKRYLRDVY